MPSDDPARRNEMALPTFVDLEELLFSTLRLHEAGSGHATAPIPHTPTSNTHDDPKAS